MNETNADGPTDGEQILWSQLAERDEVNAQLRARIAELERRVEELTEEKNTYESHMLQAEGQVATLRADVERLKAELAYLKLQRDALLEITWLDLPDEPDESTKRWRDLFNAGWERKCVSEELRAQLAEREEDQKDVDWLELQYVEVRIPLLCGSRFAFLCTPVTKDGEAKPSNLRAAIRAARAQPEGGK